jgi:SPP1 family predicted phage head-tail adaptor
MDAGRLDRRVTILARGESREATYGTKTDAWAPVATVWAEVRDVLPSRGDRLADELVITSRPARVRMRWRDDVTQANRVEIDGRQMRIVAGPACSAGATASRSWSRS